MKTFITGVDGQLGHDVMNELTQKSHEGFGSDIQDVYSEVDGLQFIEVQLERKNSGSDKNIYDTFLKP